MPLTLGDKAQRVLKFLLGLNDRAVAALVPYGFGEAVIEEGWALLRAVSRSKGGIVAASASLTAIEELDAWENHWFPIASIALARHHPAAHARLFLNLSQTEGPEVAVTVGLLLERLEEMANPEGPYGAEGPKALKLLETRGLTPAVIGQARSILASFAKPSRLPRSLEEVQAELARAEKALWDWYLEWGQVARLAIKQRALLRQLGFLKAPRTSNDEEEGEETEDVETPAVPGTNPLEASGGKKS